MRLFLNFNFFQTSKLSTSKYFPWAAGYTLKETLFPRLVADLETFNRYGLEACSLHFLYDL